MLQVLCEAGANSPNNSATIRLFFMKNKLHYVVIHANATLGIYSEFMR